MVSEGRGFGKVILFGEHFVVYNLPGIASGISDYTTATVEDGGPGTGFQLVDIRPQSPGYGEKKKEEMSRQFKAIFREFSIDPKSTPLQVTLAGNLYCSSGIGASAALAASTARALAEKLGRQLSDNEINRLAYIAEEAGSGTPSGIDNTCSVYGKFITFEKSKESGTNKIDVLSTDEPVEIVMASTGITQETRAVVNDVRRKKEADEAWFDGVVKQYTDIYNTAPEAIKNADWKTVGELMDRNHELLRQITVSCDELEHLIRLAKDAGALGAKLTGTGRGGYIVALCPGKELQERVAGAIEDEGFKVLKTSVG